MGNKKIKFLLSVVVVIWGWVFSQLFGFFDAEIDPMVEHMTVAYTAPQVKERESFELLPIEKDPFLGTAYVQPKKAQRKSGSSANKGIDILWPAIQYLGMVEDGMSKKKVFVLRIDGQQNLLTRGEVLSEMKLVSGDEERVVISYKGKTKEFSIM
ncbi:MAG: hypothetical protein AAFP76_00030 [Bacteroidota bacterium]